MRAVTNCLFSFCLAAVCAAAFPPAARAVATAAPAVTLSRSYISFADLCIGKTAGPLCFTITNSGTADLVINSMSVINCSTSIHPVYVDCGTVAGFQIVSGGGAGTLIAGQSRTVCVTFTPTEASTVDGFVSISTNASGSPAVVQLHGTGDVCTPQATLSTSYMSFADLCIGKTAGPLCFTITNSGGGTLVINSTSVINCSTSIHPVYVDCGTVAGFQIISGGGPGSLTAGQSRTVCVTFTPTEASTVDGFVSISTNAGSATVQLHGTGDVCPGTAQATLSTSYMSFADICIGKSVGPLCFTITNSGTADLVINSIGVINCSSSTHPTYVDCNTVAGFKVVSGGGAGTLAAGASRDVCLTFTPGEAGTFDGTVSIVSNAATSPTTVQLHGTGD